MTTQLGLVHDVEHSLTITHGAHTILAYHYGDVERYPYCHPVNLPDGPAVTLSRPFDHDWHLGLYFSWKYLNGYNVWEGPNSNEPYGGTQHVDLDVIPDRGRGAGFRHTIDWVTSDGTPLLRDTRVVIVRPPTSSAYYSIDWLFSFVPLVDQVHFDRKIEWGGYAGLSVRFPRSFFMPKVLNADGQIESSQTHAARSAWTDYSGWIDGLGRKAWGGITMIDHPSNARHPTPWLTFDRPALQFLNAAFVRDEPFTLQGEETLSLAYRVLVHWDEGKHDLIEAEAQRFSALNPALEANVPATLASQ